MDRLKKYLLVSILLILSFFHPGYTQDKAKEPEAKTDGRILSIEEFVQSATKNDTVFDEILIDQMKLAYRKDLALPARDIILSVKGQYDLFLNQNREDPETTFSLSKLFPYTGTDVSVSYENSPSSTSLVSSSELEFLISQPIAENAFGKSTRLLDKIVGIEVDVIRYQITEAYEDYLASLITTYYNWYSAYEDLKIGEASYQQNQKLLDNMLKRQNQKIALSVDVNKVELLVLNKKENLIGLKESYQNLSNLVRKAVRYEGAQELVPADPSAYHSFEIMFENDYQRFTQSSRTYEVLGLLENKTSLEVKKSADDLLPSTNLLLGYQVDGKDWGLKNEETMAFAGLSVEWPFSDQVQRAEHEVSKVQHKKTQLSNQNKYLELYTNLRNLYLQVNREQELIKIAEEKISLAEAVLEDEAENYSFGKITLNDYIDAVNRVDENNFNKIFHTVQLKKLLVEWMRLTDKLVGEVNR